MKFEVDFGVRPSIWIFQAGYALGLAVHQLDQEAAQALFLGSSQSREAQTGEEALNGADGRPGHPNFSFASGHLQLEFQGRILGQFHVGFQPAAAHSEIGHNTLALCLSV